MPAGRERLNRGRGRRPKASDERTRGKAVSSRRAMGIWGRSGCRRGGFCEDRRVLRADFEERTRVRAESTKLKGWPPNTREFVVEQQSEIFLPAPFSPKLEPRKLGGLYEIGLYTLKPGGIPGVIDRWSTAIAERVKLSPLAFAGHSEFGGLNRWCHIWAYKDAAERFAVREKARTDGIWPPSGGQPGQTLVQENMLVVPAAFSPLH